MRIEYQGQDSENKLKFLCGSILTRLVPAILSEGFREVVGGRHFFFTCCHKSGLRYRETRSLGARWAQLLFGGPSCRFWGLQACLTLSFAPFEHSGHVTHATLHQILRNSTKVHPYVRLSTSKNYFFLNFSIFLSLIFCLEFIPEFFLLKEPFFNFLGNLVWNFFQQCLRHFFPF